MNCEERHLVKDSETPEREAELQKKLSFKKLTGSGLWAPDTGLGRVRKGTGSRAW